jgi:hypothetical protein
MCFTAFRTTILSLSVTAGIVSVWSSAEAGCVALWARRLSDPATIHRSEFQPGDQFVVCFRFPDDSFVSLWDVPPHGDASRLFPNVLTHKQENATTRAAELAGGKDYCFGAPDTFPLFFPTEQGSGSGKISIHVTKQLDSQPALSDFTVPGERALRASVVAPAAAPANDISCGPKMIAWFDYKISR